MVERCTHETQMKITTDQPFQCEWIRNRLSCVSLIWQWTLPFLSLHIYIDRWHQFGLMRIFSKLPESYRRFPTNQLHSNETISGNDNERCMTRMTHRIPFWSFVANFNVNSNQLISKRFNRFAKHCNFLKFNIITCCDLNSNFPLRRFLFWTYEINHMFYICVCCCTGFVLVFFFFLATSKSFLLLYHRNWVVT